jgi:hypothetical protein
MLGMKVQKSSHFVCEEMKMTSLVSESRQSIFGAGQTLSCFAVWYNKQFTDILASVSFVRMMMINTV